MHQPLTTTPPRHSPHFGVVAVILLRLDARPAEWITVLDLAQHLGCAPATVRTELEQLSANGLVKVDRFTEHNATAEALDMVGEIRAACIGAAI